MKRLLFLAAISVCSFSHAQDSAKPGGLFALGMRSTFSLFNHDGNSGSGVGGQFRLRLLERVNTDWFADYIKADIGGLGERTDYHIGWSVLFYPLNYQRNAGTVTPYFIAGHCFDYTRVRSMQDETMPVVERWSSAIQGGIGAHYNITQRFDLTVNSQYMMHLGKQVHAEVEQNVLHIHKEDSAGLEGHLLVTVGFNYQFADLWSR